MHGATIKKGTMEGWRQGSFRRAEQPLSKQYGSGFAEIHSGKRSSCPESQTYGPNQVVPHQGRSTDESAPPLKGALPYSCF